MNYNIRQTYKSELYKTEFLNRETFWNFYNPGNHQNFGFKNAEGFGISTGERLNFDPFMAIEFQKNGFANVQGKFIIHGSAKINEQQLSKFEAQFPAKEKGAPKIKNNI